MTKVAVIQTENRAEGVKKAIELLSMNPVKGKDVVLKPNFNTADPTPGSTHMITLRALVEKLWDMNAKSITLAERSGPANTAEVFAKKGVHELAEKLNFSIVNLAKAPVEDYVHLQPEESHWEKGFLFAKLFHEADSIVETCCLKTHQYGGHFTLSLKNAVGMVPRRTLDGNSYMRELHNSPHQHDMIAEINCVFEPDLIVLDGITAFVDGGPAHGTRKYPKVILAGTDRVAIDATGVAILRILGTTAEVNKGKIFEQDQIRRAVDLNLGISSPSDIELITDSKETASFAQRIREKLNE